jgi:hypothetical protein
MGRCGIAVPCRHDKKAVAASCGAALPLAFLDKLPSMISFFRKPGSEFEKIRMKKKR